MFRAARDSGELLAPAADADQMQQVVTNSMINGTLQSIFAVLVIIVVLNAVWTVVKTLRSGGQAPTTEVPKVESELVTT